MLAAIDLSAHAPSLNTFGTMGMSYILITDRPTNCTGRFPHQLGYFLEAIGGYEEKSEVAQISDILKVDLSTFQNYDYGENDPEIAKTFWHDLSHYEKVIHTLMDSINAHPDYHVRVRYNRNPARTASLLQVMSNTRNVADMMKVSEELRADEQSLYPTDAGYLREGRILHDLRDLLNTLACFRGHGVEQVKLLYM